MGNDGLRHAWSLTALLLLALFWVISPLPARAENSEIARLVSAGRPDLARWLLMQTQPSPAGLMFFEAQVQKHLGHLDAAIAILRAVLRLQPDHLDAQRELAHCLYLARLDREAADRLRALAEQDRTPRLQSQYRAMLRSLRDRRPWRVDLDLNLVRSSNANRGGNSAQLETDAGTFDIPEDDRARPATGLRLGVLGRARLVRWQSAELVLNADAAITVGSAPIGPRYETGLELALHTGTKDSTASFSGFERRDWRAGVLRSVRKGAAFEWGRVVAEDLSIAIEGELETRQYPESLYSSGDYSSLAVSATRAFTHNFDARAFLKTSRYSARADHHSYAGLEAGAEFTRRWASGLEASLEVSTGQRAYVGDYPLFSYPRDDGFLRGSFTVTSGKSLVGDFRPRLGCEAVRNRSNIGLHAYRATDCWIEFVRSF